MAISSRRIVLLPVLIFAIGSGVRLHFDGRTELRADDSVKKYQYFSEGIEIVVPTADEPRRASFDANSISAASKYLDDGALCWVRENGCINCHTTGPYLSERPALTRFLGKPKEEVRANFLENIPAVIDRKIKPTGAAYFPVWRSLGLAEWDRYVAGGLSPETDRSLQDMFRYQADDGRFIAIGEVEIPHITTDFELTLQAARAITSAPGWLPSLKDSELLAQIEKMKEFLRTAEPRNDYERLLRLQLSSMMPELVSESEIALALSLLTDKQHSDGGWSLRDMSAVENWRTPMSEKVLGLIHGLPDAAHPESDAYMTAFAIVLLRGQGVDKQDPRIVRGIGWLKSQQRESGRWWMHSLYRGNYHYITYIATAQAIKALAACDELPADIETK